MLEPIVLEDSPHLDEIVDPLATPEDREELLRYLGYRGPKARRRSLTDEIERVISRGRHELRPRGVYSIHPILSQDARQIRVRQQSLNGQVAGFLEGARSLAVFVVTVGHAITECSRAAADAGNVVEAWALDALGSWAADAAADAMARRLTTLYPDSGALSPRYSPGYCGIALTQQRVLFELVDASRIGVVLHDNMLMQPHKSVSGVVGIGSAATFDVGGTPCDRCESVNCSMRR